MEDKKSKCDECDGKGKIKCPGCSDVKYFNKGEAAAISSCAGCHGTGYMDCRKCEGKGKITE